MKISEYMMVLSEIITEEGDLEMMHTSLDGHVRPVHMPKVRHMLILTGKQHKTKYWTGSDPVERKGQKIVEA